LDFDFVRQQCTFAPGLVTASAKLAIKDSDGKQPMKKYLFLLAAMLSGQIWAGIPATPVMTLYRFNGDLEVPYYRIDAFQKSGTAKPAGRLTQGSFLIPCLVIRKGKPLTDRSGTPFVGFELLVDARKATPADTEKFKQAVAERKAMTVANHHCDGSAKYIINVRRLFALEKAPFFDPPVSDALQQARKRFEPRKQAPSRGELDAIIRAFHNSEHCEHANTSLVGRRNALDRAWSRFVADNQGRWPRNKLQRARHLDYTMRTAIFEAHLDRGCNAYGTCERNVIALSIRNRGRESCQAYQGCKTPGDFQGVASKVSQYNIWDEYLTQISGLTSCFLRQDLGSGEFTLEGRDSPKAAYYDKIRTIYEVNLADVQRILFGNDQDLLEIFPGVVLGDLKTLRHYYHAPAMGKCFPEQPRVEYMSGAVARKGKDYALIANTRIHVDKKAEGGYLFRDFVVDEAADRDVTSTVDRYPGFVVDGRKVSLRGSARCLPYGVPRGCKFDEVGRYRKTPSWAKAGKPLRLRCRIRGRGEQCREAPSVTTVNVGAACDTQMRPFAGVP
jgi:hypothetical protein